MEAILIIKQLMSQLKLKDVFIYDTRPITPFYDFAIVATAGSQRQLGAAIDHLLKSCGEHNLPFRGAEGKKQSFWALIDFGSVVVHVFTKEERELFALDKLWKDLFLEQIA
ncbi:MAG TPA: ribosome silencing factor [Bacilli bacterium]|nr:MAG: Ribosomal silencing factor RsfS [Tenericutes bacterium ADurb.BinA124]HNZ50903.1 ribosome silencing factor [Bacilli bacterium]HPN60831.1 ribosome silencing factor [Bacilli bacterium]HPX84866.1 ribosome silencing factor [Bacilli bacterium]HQC75060.1 ribosome silencing factor [Bacilli bacterium]